MKTKTWKIGECCAGGILTCIISGKVIHIEAKDWNSKKVISKGTAQADMWNAEGLIRNYLNDLTTSYYSEKVLDWIKSVVKLA